MRTRIEIPRGFSVADWSGELPDAPITTSSITIDVSDGEQIIQEIHEKRHELMAEHNLEGTKILIDSRRYLKLKHYIIENERIMHGYADGWRNDNKFMGMEIIAVPFRKCLKVICDSETTAMRLSDLSD